MKIYIIGSSAFAKQMVEYKGRIEELGHSNSIHEHYVAMAEGQMNELVMRMGHEHAEVKKQYDYLRYHFNEIKKSDAVLVLNFDRKGIKNYIGANTLIEIGQAHVLDKKVFILNPVVEQEYIKEEIDAIDPVILNGDLTKIK